MGEELVKAYSRFRTEAGRMLSSKFPAVPAADREDFIQVAYERTARKWLREQLGPECDPVPYAIRTARNLAIDSLRKRRLVPLDHDGPEGPDRVVVPLGRSDEGLDVVIRAIRRMAPTQRRAVVELQSGGAEDDEICAELGIPRKQVQVQRTKAIRELRHKLRRHIRLKRKRKQQQQGEGDSGE
ncbi:sigma-70 family RNA polymerase sigma factor [Streptomyces sp. A1547]|uniref:RNA polymerase sigma factor n=1 Tax=Streptomyces sp. A1547 TaxID=2563105 RepID=UPI00144A64B8|nr:sigma-70 family RNA polymerase sigma factor [Streptomyces sp. A1547]